MNNILTYIFYSHIHVIPLIQTDLATVIVEYLTTQKQRPMLEILT